MSNHKSDFLEHSDSTLDAAEDMAEHILAHYGVKGMKWGKRKKSSDSDSGPTDVTTSHTPGQRVKATGGTKQPAHEDAIRTATARQKAKASTLDALSDKELKSLVNRMNMEKQYAQLVAETAPRSKGQKFVEGLIGMVQVGGKQYGQQFINEQMKNRMDEALGVNKQREKSKDENAAREKIRREKYK